jgi:thiol:disulfide interchange protein
MKLKYKLASLVVALLFLTAWVPVNNPNEVNFYKDSYDNFLREAKKQHKPVILEFWASWCGPCKKLNQETFSDKDFAAFLNKNFLVYKVDIDSFDGIKIVEKFNVQAFPTLLVADSKGNEVSQLKGFLYASYLQKTLDELNDKYQLFNSLKKEQIVVMN